jgi:hypothetical protein
VKRWAAIPLAFRVGVLASVCSTVALALSSKLAPEYERMEKLQLAATGIGLVFQVFVLVGALELSKLLVGRAALGAKIAATGWGLGFAFLLLGIALRTKDGLMHDHVAYFQWGWFAVTTLTAIGLAMMVWRIPVLSIFVVVVIVVFINRPPPLDQWIFDHMREHLDAYSYLRSGLRLLHAALLLGVALVAVAELPEGFTMAEPQRARIGLDRMAAAMWMRVVGAVVLPLLTVMIVIGDGHGAETILGYGALLGTGLSIVSLAWFGVGALDVARSHHEAVRRGAFVAVAAASLWCAGVTLQQVPDLYGALLGREAMWARESGYATMFPYLLPLVATASIIAGALAVSGFASRRGHLELAARGERTAMIVGVMQLFAIAVTTWCLPEARSTGSALLLMLMALVFGLIAVVSMAHLARDAAYAVEAPPPELPSAQLL